MVPHAGRLFLIQDHFKIGIRPGVFSKTAGHATCRRQGWYHGTPAQ